VEFIKRYRWVIGGVVAVGVVVAFLAFRPDKLFVDDTVDESLSDAFTTTTAARAPSTTSSTADTDASPGSSTTSTAGATTTTQAPTAPVQIALGSFYGIDHSAMGTAAVYEQDGTFVLRFEDDTDIQNGPDLFVWLLADSDYTEGTPPDFIDLGKIKGNVGGQNYALPAEYDPDVHQFVLIWCKRFAVPFAAAPLA
jgi:hypothetical protein